MDIFIQTYYGVFQCSKEKDELNRRKHGISFQDVLPVFQDAARLDFYDEISSINEDRFKTIGRIGNLFIIVVVHTERNESIRLISARKATKNEERIYMGTDWERLTKMNDEEAYENALDDPDNPPLADKVLNEFVRTRDIPGRSIMEKYENLRKKRYKKLVAIRYDADVLEYFKAKGKGYQSLMNDALRAFMQAEMEQKA